MNQLMVLGMAMQCRKQHFLEAANFLVGYLVILNRGILQIKMAKKNVF